MFAGERKKSTRKFSWDCKNDLKSACAYLGDVAGQGGPEDGPLDPGVPLRQDLLGTQPLRHTVPLPLVNVGIIGRQGCGSGPSLAGSDKSRFKKPDPGPTWRSLRINMGGGAGLRSVYEFQLIGHLHTGVNTGRYTLSDFFFRKCML